ncbi:MAG: hypothetical protein ACE5HS_23125 [bacterium]
MSDICVPLPRFEPAKSAQVQVKIENHQILNYNYRVEAFEWLPDDELSDRRIQSLKRNIESYDNDWELIQIYNPGPRDKHIQVLFRERVVN